MELLAAGDVPRRHTDRVFREDRLTKLIAFAVFLGLMLAALVAGVFPEAISPAYRPPRVLPFLVAGGLLVFVLVSLYSLRSSVGSGNWLLRLGRDRLYLNLRSYLNAHFPAEDRVIVALDRDEIDWVAATTERRAVPAGDGRQSTERWTYLDLGVAADTAVLEEALRAERRREAPMVRRARTKAEHYPVRVAEPGVIRVEWKGPSTRIRPSIERTIDILRRSFPLRHPLELSEEDARRLEPEEAEARIRKHAERGEILAATRLARRTHGMSLTEARAYVDELREA